MRSLGIIFSFMVCSLCMQAQISSAKWKVIETEADTLLERQDFKGAIELYNKVADLSKLKDKESKGMLYKRAVCFYSIGDYDRALQDINAFIPDFGHVAQAKLLRAFINRERGDSEAQLSDLNELLSLNPMNIDLQKWRSAIYLDTEKYLKAKQELTNLQKLVNDEEIETQLGFAYSNLENPDSAFVHFENALSINGGYLPAYMYLSSLCLEQGAFDAALTYVDLGLRLEPSNLNLLFYKGVVLAEKENTAEACRLLSKVFYEGLDQAGDYLKQYCYTADK